MNHSGIHPLATPLQRREHGSAARPPGNADVFLFFVALPLLFALWAQAIGMAPASLLRFGDAYLYIATQVAAAWWVNGLACVAVALVLRARQPRPWQIMLPAFWLAWVPLILFYRAHAAFFAELYPLLLARDGGAPPLTAGYVWELLRYSTPFLPLWLAAVYGYEWAFGVRWFAPRVRATVNRRASGQGATAQAPASGATPEESNPPAAQRPPEVEPPSFLADSRLQPDALIIAVKAEEHYVHVWSDDGTDLIRYRFRDAVAELADLDGDQVHRSWWINWNCVAGATKRGRSLALRLRNDMEVPVSLAHKAEVARRLAAR